MRYASYLSDEDKSVLHELRVMLAVYGNSSVAVQYGVVEILNTHCGPDWFVTADEVPVPVVIETDTAYVRTVVENTALKEEIKRLHKELGAMTKGRDFLRECMQNHLRRYREEQARANNPVVVPMAPTSEEYTPTTEESSE